MRNSCLSVSRRASQARRTRLWRWLTCAAPFRVCSWNRKHESSAYVLIRSQIHPNGSDRFLAIYLPHGLRPSSENLFAYLFRLPTPPVVTDVVDQIVDLNAVKMILSLPTTDLSSTAHLMKAPPTFLTRSHRDRGLDVFPHKHLLPSRVVLAASVSSSCSNPQQPRKLKVPPWANQACLLTRFREGSGSLPLVVYLFHRRTTPFLVLLIPTICTENIFVFSITSIGLLC